MRELLQSFGMVRNQFLAYHHNAFLATVTKTTLLEQLMCHYNSDFKNLESKLHLRSLHGKIELVELDSFVKSMQGFDTCSVSIFDQNFIDKTPEFELPTDKSVYHVEDINIHASEVDYKRNLSTESQSSGDDIENEHSLDNDEEENTFTIDISELELDSGSRELLNLLTSNNIKNEGNSNSSFDKRTDGVISSEAFDEQYHYSIIDVDGDSSDSEESTGFNDTISQSYCMDTNNKLSSDHNNHLTKSAVHTSQPLLNTTLQNNSNLCKGAVVSPIKLITPGRQQKELSQASECPTASSYNSSVDQISYKRNVSHLPSKITPIVITPKNIPINALPITHYSPVSILPPKHSHRLPPPPTLKPAPFLAQSMLSPKPSVSPISNEVSTSQINKSLLTNNHQSPGEPSPYRLPPPMIISPEHQACSSPQKWISIPVSTKVNVASKAATHVNSPNSRAMKTDLSSISKVNIPANILKRSSTYANSKSECNKTIHRILETPIFTNQLSELNTEQPTIQTSHSNGHYQPSAIYCVHPSASSPLKFDSVLLHNSHSAHLPQLSFPQPKASSLQASTHQSNELQTNDSKGYNVIYPAENPVSPRTQNRHKSKIIERELFGMSSHMQSFQPLGNLSHVYKPVFPQYNVKNAFTVKSLSPVHEKQAPCSPTPSSSGSLTTAYSNSDIEDQNSGLDPLLIDIKLESSDT